MSDGTSSGPLGPIAALRRLIGAARKEPMPPPVPPMIDDIIARQPFDPSRKLKQADPAPMSQRFFFFFTPRSGSSWLAVAMRRTRRLGIPDEYFNADFVVRQATANNVNTLETYIDALLRRRVSPNRVFVAKVSPFHLNYVRDRETFFAMLPAQAPSIYLIRENIVRQAISLYKAVETDVYHVVNRPDDAVAHAKAFDNFDGEKILRWLRHVTEQERVAREVFATNNIRPLVLSYEWVFANERHVVPRIAEHYGIELSDTPSNVTSAPASGNPHRSVSGPSNHALEDAFRRRYGAMLKPIEAARAPLLAAVADAPSVFRHGP